MNAVAARHHSGFLKRSWNALNSALAVGLILALLGWSFQFYETRQAARQTANLQRISEFTSDAAASDRSVVRFFDAAADGKNLAATRDSAEQALVNHSIEVESLRDVFGASASDQYLQAVDELKENIEATNDATHAGANVTALGRVIQLRRDMVQKARDDA